MLPGPAPTRTRSGALGAARRELRRALLEREHFKREASRLRAAIVYHRDNPTHDFAADARLYSHLGRNRSATMPAADLEDLLAGLPGASITLCSSNSGKGRWQAQYTDHEQTYFSCGASAREAIDALHTLTQEPAPC
jgi:hypothetical protein